MSIDFQKIPKCTAFLFVFDVISIQLGVRLRVQIFKKSTTRVDVLFRAFHEVGNVQKAKLQSY
jgi:hypothetical protein